MRLEDNTILLLKLIKKQMEPRPPGVLLFMPRQEKETIEDSRALDFQIIIISVALIKGNCRDRL